VITRNAGRARLVVHAGIPCFRRADAATALDRVAADLGGGESFDTVVSCANGTFVDAIERTAVAKHAPEAMVIAPKRTLGESLGAGALQQIVAAALIAERGEARRVLVPVVGWNQQVSGAVVLV
jgi:hypothetical protein